MLRLSAVLLTVLFLGVDLMSLAIASPSPQPAEVGAFTVIGLTVRTTNAREMSGKDGQIGPLWRQFMHGGAAAIPGVVEPETTYAVYSHYDSDETGSYDLILGKSVRPGQEVPPAMKGISIPAARYLVFTASASSPDAIQSAWTQVYEYFAQHKKQRRAFSADFEQYSSSGIRLFIAVQ
jgi:predicted transcriptional regulator YdeE